MEGMSDPQDSGAWRFRRLVLAAALLVCGFAVVLLSRSPTSVRLVVSWSRAGRWMPRHARGVLAPRPAGAPAAVAGPGPGGRSPASVLGSVQPAARHLSGVGPEPEPDAERHRRRRRADHRRHRGLATFPLAPATRHRHRPDGAGRHRARRFEPVRGQRPAVSADPRRPGPQQLPSASSSRSSTWSSRPSRPCCSSAARPPTGPRSASRALGFVCIAWSDFSYAVRFS